MPLVGFDVCLTPHKSYISKDSSDVAVVMLRIVVIAGWFIEAKSI